MWIVTRQATDPGIVAVIAFAVRETIRLEANINHPAPPDSYNRFPGTMTLAAEFRYFF
jgi:hypothetical protein